jgi:dTDP-L-rhamnose 4-epimerase
MTDHVLITGGAGFIGSHLADELLRHGHRVRALDDLSPQVHGAGHHRPRYLAPEVELCRGDVRDPAAMESALRDVTAVYHFAARLGVGQSMYQISDYTSVNAVGTSVLLEALAKKPVRRLVVASSMSVYGEGLYRTSRGELVTGASRALAQIERRDWEVRSETGEALVPLPTPETKPPSLESVYALSKYDQERLCLIAGRAYGIPTVALRFFNVYGPRQALSNPYTGVLAIFAARLLNDGAPPIFEDGLQRRDFVSVHDVVRACRRALHAEAAVGLTINVGSGVVHSVRDVALALGRVLGKEAIAPEMTGRCRIGDVRHCFADITLARRTLGYEPQIMLEDGLRDLAGWLEGRTADDGAMRARAELEERGLTR